MINFSDEHILLAELKAGRPGAFRRLFEEYRYWMLLQAIAYLRDEHAAQELVYELLADFWQYRLYENINTTLKGYLVSVIRNRARNYMRAAIRYEQRLKQMPIQEYLLPDLDLDKTDILAELEKALLRLPPQMHRVITYFFMDGLSHKQIAELTGNSRHTISNQIDKAKKSLKKQLNVIILNSKS